MWCICKYYFLRWISVPLPQPPPQPIPGETSLHQQNKSVESPWVVLMLFTIRFRLRVNSSYQRLWWHRFVEFCGTGRFSYGVSPRTPPLEGTSLHRRNTSMERPWGILSLFTTCFGLRVNLPCQWLWHRHVYISRLGGTGPVEKVVIFTVNHRRTLTSWGGRILILSESGFRSPKAGTKTSGLLVWIFTRELVTQACVRIIKHHGRGYVT